MAQQNLSDADTGPVAKSKIQGNFDELYASAVPTGGSLGQVLAKASASDYDAEWATPSGGLPTGVTSPGDGALDFSTGTLTANRPSLNVTQTWNNAAVTFNGFKVNITDTASNAASLLLDIQAGGASRFSVRKDGQAAVSGQLFIGGVSSPAALLDSFGGAGLLSLSSDGSSESARFRPPNTTAGSATFSRGVSFSSTGSLSSNFYDSALIADAANTLAQRNGTAAQAFNVYNTYTDTSNYERGFARFSGNVFQIGTEAAGTGVARELRFMNTVQVPNGSASAPAYSFSSASNTGIYWDGSNINFAVNGTRVAYFNGVDANFPKYTIDGRSVIRSITDSNIILSSNSQNAFNLLQLGGTSSSFPAVKRSSAAVHIRLADDSDFADLVFRLPTSNPGPGTLWNNGGTLTIGT